jgi:hypothetical protein
MFKDGRKNGHNEEQSRRPSAVSDDLVQSVDQKICERWRLTISELICECPQMSRTLLYEIIILRLGYHEFCTRILNMLTSAHKTQRMSSAWTFFRAMPQRFLSHIVQVTGNETWDSFVIVETKEL